MKKGWDIQAAIRELSRTFTCNYCKKEKEMYTPYEIPSRDEKFCSLNCQRSFKKENNIQGNSNFLKEMTFKEVLVSIFILILIIALIVWIVRRKKFHKSNSQD